MNIPDQNGWTILTAAVLYSEDEEESLEVISEMLDLGINPHIQSNSGHSVIHVACHLGHDRIVKLFCD